MAGFNTKLNLSDNKVYQGDGQTLTLSGDTVIALSGTLKYVSGVTFNDDYQLVDKKYVDDQILGATGSTVYSSPLLSPAAVAVGGINIGYVLTGKTSNEIIQDLLFPEIFGTLTNACVSSLVLAPSTTPLEIGYVIPSMSVTANFSRGSINPQGCSASPNRSGLPNTYCFSGAQISGARACTAVSAVTGVTSHSVVAGSNTWGVCVASDAGVQPKSNKNNNFSSPLGACTSPAVTSTITGILPYFYGISDTTPTPGSPLIATGSKVVATSTGQININFGTNTGKYLWFATPNASTTKLGWYEGATNKGNIGSGSDLFNAPATPTVDSPNSCWTGEVYKVYSSNYATNTSGTLYCMTNTTQQ